MCKLPSVASGSLSMLEGRISTSDRHSNNDGAIRPTRTMTRAQVGQGYILAQAQEDPGGEGQENQSCAIMPLGCLRQGKARRRMLKGVLTHSDCTCRRVCTWNESDKVTADRAVGAGSCSLGTLRFN